MLLASPIMQGDVFDHVSVPGLSEHPLTVAVVMQFRPPGAVVEVYRAAWRRWFSSSRRSRSWKRAHGGYRVGVASPVPQPSVSEPAAPRPPAADPVAIRACLTPDVAAVFDAEWEHVLDEAKQSKDLAGVRELLAPWRHFAYPELRAPGAYFRVLAKAARIQATGKPAPGSVPGEEIRAVITARLAEAGLTEAEQGR